MPKRLCTGAAAVIAVALLAALLHGWESLQDPLFSGDPSYRVFFADRPIVKLGNRIWLPFLQLHIWLYHLLQLPVAGLKLISVAYLLLALSALGLYWRRLLGPGPLSLTLATLAVVSFAAQPLNAPLSDLMQEPAGYGLLFLLAWLFARQPILSPLTLAIAAAALLARDTYWIYLFALSLLHLRQLRSYAILWAVPTVWLTAVVPAIYWVAYHRPPHFPAEWPLMTNLSSRNPSLLDTVTSLSTALLSSRVAFLAAGVALAALLLRRHLRHPFANPSAPTLTRAIPLALLLVYGILLAVDPWQETPGNIRMAAPLLELSFLLAPLLLQAAASAPRFVRQSATAAIVAGLIFSAWPSSAPPLPQGRKTIHASHASLKAILDAAGQANPASACLMAPDRWQVFRELGAPTFYHRKTYLPPAEPFPTHCQVIVLDQSLEVDPPAHFRQIDSLSTGDSRWRVYVTLESPEATAAPASPLQRVARLRRKEAHRARDLLKWNFEITGFIREGTGARHPTPNPTSTNTGGDAILMGFFHQASPPAARSTPRQAEREP